MRFLGNVFATIVGLFVFCMLFFFVIIAIGAIAGSSSEQINVKRNSVIELDLSKIKYDYAGKTYFKDFNYYDAEYNGLSDVIKAIENAKDDEDIRGISIINNTFDLGIAQTKALRDELEDFKKSGKFVMSYADTYSQKDYYLNSVANKIYINPVGELEFKGLSSEIMFYKDFQDKTGFKMEVIRHGKYKSAVEPYLENKMSEANREQISTLLNSIWNSIVDDISKSRKISKNRLNIVANELLARTPEMAKAEKLVDVIAYEDVYHNEIKKLLKIDSDKEYNKINIEDYALNVANQSKTYDTKDKIAIIYAQGEILSGEGDVSYIGEGSMRRSLQEARLDKNVKAIVLRIDSPGGSALTSDLIWREIELTKKVKPVVVSMGNLAASGGYYIACNANKIFAEANTITGSIGVYGTLPNFTQAANKIGINVDQVKTHENAANYSLFKPLDNKFRNFTQEGVEKVYTTFINRVSQGRKMSPEKVDLVAQGRVWSGADALKIGLVDQIGGMDDAIIEAAKMAKIKTFKTQNYPEYEKDFSDFISKLGIPFLKSKENLIKEEIGAENYMILQKIKRMSSQKGIQAMLPFEFSIN